MRNIAILIGVLALAPWPALAGNLYKCAGADGKTVYQQTPCPSRDAQLERRSFASDPDPAPVRQVGAPAAAGPGYPTWEDTHPTGSNARSTPATYDDPASHRPSPQRAAAYECVVNGMVVVRESPCPSGSTQTRTLDRSQLCDQLRDNRGEVDRGRTQRVYARNKARGRNNC